MTVSLARARSHARALCLAVVVAVAMLVATVGTPHSDAAARTAAQQTAPSFGVPRVVDPIHTYGEPDVKVGPARSDRTADMIVSGPAGTGTQRSVLNYSVDGGDSFRVVADVPQGAQPAEVPSKSTDGPGGGDTEAVFGRDGTLFYDDLYALTCFEAAVVTDSGANVRSTPAGCSFPGGDRQWYGLFDPAPADQSVSPYHGSSRLLYLTYDDLQEEARVDKSVDGLSFTQAGVYGDGTDGYSVADSNLVVDQKTGDVLAAVVGEHHALGLAVGEPNASGDLTFHYNAVTGPRPGDPELLFPVVAQDSARNLYLVWAEECDISGPTCFHVFYTSASAAAGWTDWAPPRQVDSPPSNTNVFPWLAAGGDGLIDVVWYGTDLREDPSKLNPDKAWNVYLAQISRADTARPRIQQARVSPHPNHYSDICLNGAGCITGQGNRNLADFFQVTIDNEGRARVVYDDTSNGLIQQGFEPTSGVFDHAGAPVVTLATQSAGLNMLTGDPLPPGESTAPVTGVGDPLADALVNKPLGGTNAPGADITDVSLARAAGALQIEVTTTGDSLGAAAAQAGAAFGQLVVRWQEGRDLYYAEVEQPATGGPSSFFAGGVQSIDLCSVSACTPHYLTYPGPPNGGSEVTGTADPAAGGGTTYVLTVPLDAVGDPAPGALLEEVAAYAFAAPQSARQPVTNAQAEVEQGIPVQIEGTRTFNSRP
jgi:hypothetical protein